MKSSARTINRLQRKKGGCLVSTNYKEQAEILKKRLFLKTEPIGIGLLKIGDKKPENFLEPLKDLGHHLSTCQGFSLSRRNKKALLMTFADMWCFEPAIGFGLTKPPVDFLEGHNRYPGTASSIEAGKEWASHMPRFPEGKYEGIFSAPLSFFGDKISPDAVIIYCDPSQLTQIMTAVNWIDGRDVYSRISGHAACVYAVVPAIQDRNFQVVVPCGGDRIRAAAQDSEIIFSFPVEKLDKLVEALEAIEITEGGLPLKSTLKEEYTLDPCYKKMGLIMGMKLD